MNKKQNYSIFGLIAVICALVLLTCSFLMPPKPTYEVVNIDETQVNQNDTNVNTSNENNNQQTYTGVVVLDPGHGGYDNGASSADGRIVEKEFDLKIAMRVKTILESKGIKVILTRTNDNVSWPSDNGKDLQARLDIATNANANLMVSIHCNVSDEDIYNVSGSEVYANADQANSTSLAKSIVSELNNLKPEMPSRGVKTAKLHLTLFNKVPTVIVEMGFISNPKDVEYLMNDVTQTKMVDAIANGILNYLKTDE